MRTKTAAAPTSALKRKAGYVIGRIADNGQGGTMKRYIVVPSGGPDGYFDYTIYVDAAKLWRRQANAQKWLDAGGDGKGTLKGKGYRVIEVEFHE